MGNLIKAEFRKTLTTKSWWGLMIPTALLAFGFAMGWGAVTNDFSDYLGGSDTREITAALGIQTGQLPVGLLALGHGINIGTIFPMIFGVFALAGEYTKKTITTTFLTAPNRGSALTAKMITYIVWGAIYGVLIVAVASLGTVLTVDSSRLPTTSQWLGMLGAGVLATILATLFGMGLAEAGLAGRGAAQRHAERHRRRHRRGGVRRGRGVDPGAGRRHEVASAVHGRSAGGVLVVGFGVDLLRVDDGVLRSRLGGQPEA
jgi:hypothetical protein